MIGENWRKSACKKGNNSCKGTKAEGHLVCLKNKNSKEAGTFGGE